MLQNGAASTAITYTNVTDTGLASHITNGSNIAGYLSWGFHSSLGAFYATNVGWSGNSSWYIIETIESFNGERYYVPTSGGHFTGWFSANAFRGINYSATPVAAVSSTSEPGIIGASDSGEFFGLWQKGKNFGICAWNSKRTPKFQAIGDPLVTK